MEVAKEFLPSHLCWKMHMRSTDMALTKKWRRVKTKFMSYVQASISFILETGI